MSGSHIETIGRVTHSAHNTYKVELTDGFEEQTEILCTISGKIRMNKIQIMAGDRVRVRISPYDTSRGIIIARL